MEQPDTLRRRRPEIWLLQPLAGLAWDPPCSPRLPLMPITLLWAALPHQTPLGLGVHWHRCSCRDPGGTFRLVATGQTGDGVSDRAAPTTEPPLPPGREQLPPLGCPRAPLQPLAPPLRGSGAGWPGTRRVVSSIC